jgi:hypothetical protein
MDAMVRPLRIAGVAQTVLARAASARAALRVQAEPDPIHGRREPRTGWYIGPLLTPNEVASNLRVSQPAVARLEIPSVLDRWGRR